jgi:homoserine O-acetyltransferase
MRLLWIVLTIVLALVSFSAVAADYPAPREADWIARDFKFHTGEVLSELRLHYTTIGPPATRPAVISPRA